MAATHPPPPLKTPTPTVRSSSNALPPPPPSFPLRGSPHSLTAAAPRRRRRPPPPLAMPPSPELTSAADFSTIASPAGLVSVCGFGSLLSEKSARSTFPDLINFRVAALRGFRRVFAHVAPIFYERGIANEETGEISSLSVEPCEGECIVVTVFEIDISGVPAFMEREHEFRFLAVVPEGLDGAPFANPAVLCGRYTDDEYFRIRCNGSKEIFFQSVLAAKNLGEAAYDNFLDHTFISNRRTTIREYLEAAGSSIMEEEPPESLKSRYGG